jgi:hypothetical protein
VLRLAAERVLEVLNAERHKLNPRSTGFGLRGDGVSALSPIVLLLRQGAAESVLISVVRHRAAQCARDLGQLRWLNPATLFGRGNWARNLADLDAGLPSPSPSPSPGVHGGRVVPQEWTDSEIGGAQ